MILIKHQSAIKALYYVIAVDGQIDIEETEAIDKIGAAIDPDHFGSYRDDLIAACDRAVGEAFGTDDSYDMLSERIDEELADQTDDPDLGITPRMLLWNLLVVSLANGDYDKAQSRLIRHVVRTFKIDESVFLEMEQIIQSYAAVESELNDLEKSDLPYSEIRPIVEELEKRKTNLYKHASQLIADEISTSVEAYIAKEDVVDKARSAYRKATDPVFGKVKGAVDAAFGEVKEKTAPVADDIKQSIGKTWGGLVSKFGKKKKESQTEEE